MTALLKAIPKAFEMKTVPVDMRFSLMIWILVISTSTNISIGRAGQCRLEDHNQDYRMNNKPFTVRMNKCVDESSNYIRSKIVNTSEEPSYVKVGCCCAATESTLHRVFIDNVERRFRTITTCTCEKCQ